MGDIQRVIVKIKIASEAPKVSERTLTSKRYERFGKNRCEFSVSARSVKVKHKGFSRSGRASCSLSLHRGLARATPRMLRVRPLWS